ncbi:hypothetical protein BCR32DRAFT_308545, partial [Anaeromyces robustus]
EIKNEISTDFIFKQDVGFLINNYNNKNIVFFKSFYSPTLFSDSEYDFTLIPGNKEGISGSVIGGFHLGINIYSDIKKQNAAVKALTYITSKEMQKKYVISNQLVSPIPSLYNDEDVCKLVNCSIFKNFQFIARPTSKYENYITYSYKFMNYVYEFIYGNISAIDTLTNMDNLTKLHNISLEINETYSGFILFIITLTISIILIGSLVFLYIKRFEKYFNILPKDFWVIYIIGLLVMTNNFYTTIGEISILKCYLNLSVISIGSTMYIIPLLNYLLVNFPENNIMIIRLIHHHRYIFLILGIVFDLFIILLMYITSSYTVREKFYYTTIYQSCTITNLFGKLMVYLININKGVIVLIILLLIFLEWNMKITYFNINIISISLYTNILIYVTFLIITSIINIKNYILYFILRHITHLSIIISSYISIYGIRIIISLINKNNKEKSVNEIINDLLEMANNKTTDTDNINTFNDRRSSSNKSFIFKFSKKILDYRNNLTVETTVFSNNASSIQSH